MFSGHGDDEGLLGPKFGELFRGETKVVLVDDGGSIQLTFKVVRDHFRVGGQDKVQLCL